MVSSSYQVIKVVKWINKLIQDKENRWKSTRCLETGEKSGLTEKGILNVIYFFKIFIFFKWSLHPT